MAIDPALDVELLIPWLRSEALSLGEDDRSIARRVRSGEWHRVRRGAYIAGEVWKELGPEDRHRVRARAVLKVAHPSTVLSHTSAAIELGAPTWDVDLRQVHVTRTDAHPGRKTAEVVHHKGLLPEDDVVRRNGVPLVPGTRAAFEVSTLYDLERALVIVDGLLNAGEADLAGLDSIATTYRRWPNSLTTTLVVRLANPLHASPGESRAHHLFWKQGIPPPVPQFPVHDETGRLVATCDFAWPDEGVFVEFDGRVKYERLLSPGEAPVDAMLAQQHREELICRLTGWVCLRLTWQDLATPRATARRLRTILDSRRSAA